MLAAIIASIVAAALAVVGIAFVMNRRALHGDDDKIKRSPNMQSISVLGRKAVTGAGGQESRLGMDIKSESRSDGGLGARFAAVGAGAGVIFGALAVKLWWMQIVNASKYEELSTSNTFTSVYSAAPRGIIYDRNGIELVRNRTSLTVVAGADVANDADVVTRLSTLLGIPRNVVRFRIQDSRLGAQVAHVVASDVRLRDLAFIAEHPDAFAGVSVVTRVVREYPYGALAAHVLGYTSSASTSDILQKSEGRDLRLGDDVGKYGVESKYDDILAGQHGLQKLITDATGETVQLVSETQPTKGSDVYLTIDAKLQYYTDTALADLIAPDNNAIGSGLGTSGACVVLDALNGEVLAMSSFPTFEPGVFVGGISNESWEIYNSDAAYAPLMNRAISGLFPAASTFKAFTGLAGMAYGYVTKESSWTCTGSWDGWESGVPQHCWRLNGHGKQNFHQGVGNSCDVVFYEIAKNFFDDRGRIGTSAMQDEVRKFGFGSVTGIDLGGESYGRIPTEDWKNEYFKDQPEEASRRGGDMTNMVIGQGYVLITPLQLACGYAGVATGTIMRPHVLKHVVNSAGKVVSEYGPQVSLVPEIRPDFYEYMRQALWGVIHENYLIRPQFYDYGVY
ncbi:MAG: penicillin-binding protein 2, partial [Eggerthellaceae bacterium]|nr:penicillin-binding protein 2 [Eggerthellaceae bacterium]